MMRKRVRARKRAVGLLALAVLMTGRLMAAELGSDVKQLIVSIAPGWDSTTGRLQCFARVGTGWKPVTAGWPVLYGKNGLIWGRGVLDNGDAGPRKRERDGRAPAGVFRIGTIYTYDSALPSGARYPFRTVGPGDAWIDDVNHPDYNKHVVVDPRNPPAWFEKQKMRHGDFAYRWLVEIRHNSDPPVAGEGSAIFFHIRRGTTRPSAGCTTMAEENLVNLMRYLRAELKPHYALLPRSEYEKKWKAWGLPSPQEAAALLPLVHPPPSTSMNDSPPLLSARGITKRFPGVVALREVSFDLQPGEIHALCGENGAGKSTLIKLLSGLHAHGSYEGKLTVQGEPARFCGIADAQQAGLAVIYQELALIEQLSVAENIFLGSEPRRPAPWQAFLDWPRVHREARQLLDRFGVRIDPHTECAQLGVGQKQLVEIVKALRKNSRILILDEPTAALAAHEVEILLTILRDLRARGIGCIYISHKLDEVFALADRITVLRDGATIWTKRAADTDPAEVIRAMVGREIHDLFPRRPRPASASAPALRVTGLRVADPQTGRVRLRDISLSVAPGEVLGLGGLMGAGRTELLMHLFGAWGQRRAGRLELDGRELPPGPPERVLRRGLVLVSEDRRRYGLVLDHSIGFNLSLSSLLRLTRAGLIDSSREFRKNDEFFRSLQVKAPGLASAVGKLSGGNQQKVVLGKALMTEPRVIFLDEPTRGIDVGAKAEIYEIINRLTDAGQAIVLVSSELPELIGMSDRILILHEGAVTGEFTRATATPERLLAAALGKTSPAACPPIFPRMARMI